MTRRRDPNTLRCLLLRLYALAWPCAARWAWSARVASDGLGAVWDDPAAYVLISGGSLS